LGLSEVPLARRLEGSVQGLIRGQPIALGRMIASVIRVRRCAKIGRFGDDGSNPESAPL
jgi:hypothetical protein